MSDPVSMTLQCPIPISEYPNIVMAHGGGGRLMHRLIERMFGAAFSNPVLDSRHDAAEIAVEAGRLAFTTDSYVVNPLFFPGGDIGSLAVNGTVNDLAMAGARAGYLSLGFIIEEGLSTADLWRVVLSIRDAAGRAGVVIATGDTKVVERGHGHGIYINTSGIGFVAPGTHIHPSRVAPGDAVILSGPIAAHGMAIMAAREGLEFDSPIESDCAPLVEPVMDLLESGIDVHCLRDATRGGVATTLVEIAETSGASIEIREADILVSEPVAAACELLGFDPLYVANEGCFTCIVAPEQAARAVGILSRHAPSRLARQVGTVATGPGLVALRTVLGSLRAVDMLSGEQLPRIC